MLPSMRCIETSHWTRIHGSRGEMNSTLSRHAIRLLALLSSMLYDFPDYRTSRCIFTWWGKWPFATTGHWWIGCNSMRLERSRSKMLRALSVRPLMLFSMLMITGSFTGKSPLPASWSTAMQSTHTSPICNLLSLGEPNRLPVHLAWIRRFPAIHST